MGNGEPEIPSEGAHHRALENTQVQGHGIMTHNKMLTVGFFLGLFCGLGLMWLML